MGRIRRMFKWGISEERVSASVLTRLQSVAGLKAGRCDAKESRPVQPVPEADIAAVKPHVTTPIWGIITLQLLAGMRPGEVLAMRGADIDTRGPIWEYVPQSHKTEHHGKRRVVFLGPRAQLALRLFLKADPDRYLFSPQEGRAEFVGNQYRDGAAAERGGKRRPKDSYSVHTYYGAIRRACKRAGVEHWHPHQLRHNAATVWRREFGIEATRTALGHASAVTTEIYAEMDRGKARDIIARVG